MMSSLKLDFQEFTFIDIGSGKGRVLMMAADYPFRRILGIELLPDLHRAAQENLNRDEILLTARQPGAQFQMTRLHR